MRSFLKNENIICVILSGGLSSRMKTHKALLKFSEQQNFLQHIIEVYQKAGMKKIIVVKNADIDFTDDGVNNDMVSIVNNYYSEKGRLYSLQLGLNESPNADYCFIQNIDNPFVTTELIKNLLTYRSNADYVSPEYNNKGGHPVLISAAIIKKILHLKEYKNTLREELELFSRYKLNIDDENCILNINLPSDYQKHILSHNKIQIL